LLGDVQRDAVDGDVALDALVAFVKAASGSSRRGGHEPRGWPAA